MYLFLLAVAGLRILICIDYNIAHSQEREDVMEPQSNWPGTTLLI